VRNNRRGGPERVLDLVAERAPNGFNCLEDVIRPQSSLTSLEAMPD
jgi:hypothetical protein